MSDGPLDSKVSDTAELKALRWMVKLMIGTLASMLLFGAGAVGWAIQMEKGVTKISVTLESQAAILIRQDKMEERTDARLKQIEDDISWFRAFRAATKKKTRDD